MHPSVRCYDDAEVFLVVGDLSIRLNHHPFLAFVTGQLVGPLENTARAGN